MVTEVVNHKSAAQKPCVGGRRRGSAARLPTGAAPPAPNSSPKEKAAHRKTLLGQHRNLLQVSSGTTYSYS